MAFPERHSFLRYAVTNSIRHQVSRSNCHDWHSFSFKEYFLLERQQEQKMLCIVQVANGDEKVADWKAWLVEQIKRDEEVQ